MIYLSNWFPLKMLMVTLVSLYIINGITGSMGYMGTRYGKRESELNRLQSRSIGQRSIANRGARFYPGSRYGGKRSYWQPTSFVPADADVSWADSPNVANAPLDCIHVPFVGVRCSRPEEASYWSNDDDSVSGGGNPSASVVSSVLPEQP